LKATPVNAITETSGTIERLSEISSAIAAVVEQQGAATQEIFPKRAAGGAGHPAGQFQYHRRAGLPDEPPRLPIP